MSGGRIHQLANLVVVEKGRCTAAPVQLLDHAVASNSSPCSGDFPAEVIEIGSGALVVFGDHFGAGTVKAHRVAERDVEIQR